MTKLVAILQSGVRPADREQGGWAGVAVVIGLGDGVEGRVVPVLIVPYWAWRDIVVSVFN